MKLFYLLLLVIFYTLNAEPIISERYQYYNIYPESKYKIDNEMYKHSPIKHNGKIFYGHNNWYIKWNYKWETKYNVCEIISATVYIDIKYQMPNIPSTFNINFETKDTFNNYYNALLEHEQKHAQYGLLAAKEIEDMFFTISKFHNCKLLKQQIYYETKKIIKKYNKMNKDYDIETEHGRLEGIIVSNFID